MKALTTLLVVGMFATTIGMADDSDDVKAAVEELFAAIRAGDANGQSRPRMPDYSNFGRGGGLLFKNTSTEQQINAFQATVDAGAKRNYQLRNVAVRVYGNAAVVTAYLVGTRTGANGNTLRMAYRRTGVWIKQGGKWREAHMHQSPIRLPQ
jgi:ketosteroid isomerase-like protein